MYLTFKQRRIQQTKSCVMNHVFPALLLKANFQVVRRRIGRHQQQHGRPGRRIHLILHIAMGNNWRNLSFCSDGKGKYKFGCSNVKRKIDLTMWAMANRDANPECRGPRQRGGDAQLRVRGRGTGKTPTLRKKGARAKDTRAAGLGISPGRRLVLRTSWDVPGKNTASHIIMTPWAPHQRPPKAQKKKQATKKKCKSDWGLRRRSFSARRRWMVPSGSKSVSRPTLQTLVVAANNQAVLLAEATRTRPRSMIGGPTKPTNIGRGSGASTWRSERRKKTAAAWNSEAPSASAQSVFAYSTVSEIPDQNMSIYSRSSIFRLLQVGNQWITLFLLKDSWLFDQERSSYI